MKKRRILALSATLLLSSFPYSAAHAAESVQTAIPTQNTIYLETADGQKKIENLSVYSLDNTNYFMLRDIGQLMNFHVEWNHDERIILLDTNREYVGEPQTYTAEGEKSVLQTEQEILVENMIFVLSGLNIDGKTYFPIRDIAKVAGFSCEWDKDTNAVIIGHNKENDMLSAPDNINQLALSYMDERLNQVLIEENDVIYRTSSKDYGDIETYMKTNIDPDFDINHYIIDETINHWTEKQPKENLEHFIAPSNTLLLRENICGYPSSSWGYNLEIINGYVKIVTTLGKPSSSLDLTNLVAPTITDEDILDFIQKSENLDIAEVRDFSIYRFYDVESAAFKANIDLVYMTSTNLKNSLELTIDL